jgi:alkylated DNA repair dioxygenase AlkB
MESLFYQDKFVYNPDEAYQVLLNEVSWVAVQERRKEAFMAHEPTEYRYIPRDDAPIYTSQSYHPLVEYFEKLINTTFQIRMNLCFLNYYADQHQALGWHSDDGEIIDQEQPIVVISLGEIRQLWIRPLGYKGDIPKENRYTLGNGSILIMPAGFQHTHQHKIPKGDRNMGGRISLTYRSKL